ncbi:MAG: hypothetical protein R6U32_05385 [Candidatus Woesearchaeota archaeon]
MPEKLKKLENDILDLFVKVNSDFGNDPVTAKITSLIFLSPAEISLEKLAEETGYSHATISSKTRMMVELGLIKKIPKPGTKRAFFWMEKDMKKIVRNGLKKMMDLKLRPIENNLPELIERYRKYSKEEEDREKLKIIKGYHEDVVFLTKEMEGMIGRIDRRIEEESKGRDSVR